jgi:hypothetical protein
MYLRCLMEYVAHDKSLVLNAFIYTSSFITTNTIGTGRQGFHRFPRDVCLNPRGIDPKAPIATSLQTKYIAFRSQSPFLACCRAWLGGLPQRCCCTPLRFLFPLLTLNNTTASTSSTPHHQHASTISLIITIIFRVALVP